MSDSRDALTVYEGLTAPSSSRPLTHDMQFSRTAANRMAASLSDEELSLAIHVVCSAFNEAYFPHIRSLSDVRQMVDVLEHERGRREKATAEHPVPRPPH